MDNVSKLQTAAYHRLDLRLGWHPAKMVELSLVARNLLDPEHPETAISEEGGIISSQVERSFYTQITFRF